MHLKQAAPDVISLMSGLPAVRLPSQRDNSKKRRARRGRGGGSGFCRKRAPERQGGAQAVTARAYRARAPIGSQAGSTMGSASSALCSSAGSALLRAAISNTYWPNQESFIV
jgi:hypothetical protein